MPCLKVALVTHCILATTGMSAVIILSVVAIWYLFVINDVLSVALPHDQTLA